MHGSKFTPNTQFRLVKGAATLNALAVNIHDSSLVYATFDLNGAAVGEYDVEATDGAANDKLTAAFRVQAGAVNSVAVRVIAPQDVRVGRTASMTVEYTNTGNTDVTAPLLQLVATNARIRLEEQLEWAGNSMYFLGISPDGPAGVLRQGQTGQLKFVFESTGEADVPIQFQVNSLRSENDLIDWNALKPIMRSPHIPADAWEAVFANLVATMGSTSGQYQRVLAEDASYLSNLGVRTADVMRLLTYEVAKADAVFAAGSLSSVVDASFPAPGINLNFVRRHEQAIHGRYAMGPFGRGWTHDWDVVARALPSGDVVIRSGGNRRFFTRQSDGSFRGVRGDYGKLTFAGGKYTLTEISSTRQAFRADGKLDFVEVDNGNRITAGYDGSGRLTSLAHSSGAVITLTYNADGRISSLTDPVGRVVSYTYDASGERLVGYTDKYGSHTYTYSSGQGLAREHALTSVDFSDDTHVTFTYDALGRLIREERDGNTVPTTYTYLPGGGYVVADGLNHTTTILHDERGLTRRTIDPLGHVFNMDYDANLNLVKVNLPEGTAYRYEYDERGNVTRVIDAAGRDTTFTYDGRDNLTSFTDSLGRKTQYAYDAQDNLTSITNPAGRAELFAYDAQGNVVTRTNRCGNEIDYTYNANGQPLTRTLKDGSVITYTYDSRSRLQTATDAAGTITLSYNANDTLQKITYADGKSLSFEYNIVGQRTRSVDQDGFTVNYLYDDLGRLEEMTDGTNARIVKYAYDAAGRLVREDKGNGTATTYLFDAASQLKKVTHLKPDATVNSFFEYQYDVLGRRTSMTTGDGTTNYEYDTTGQLTKVSLPGGRTIQYVYDAAGNRTQVIDSATGTTNYTVNTLNEYQTVGNTSYTYDADGNLVSKTDASGTTTYTFNDENRLTGVNGPGLATSYRYNAFGMRDQTVVNGTTTNFLLDPAGLGNVVGEYTGGGAVIANYTHGYGLVSRVAGGAAAYYDFDANANTIGMTDVAGVYVNRYSYLPFGETTVIGATLANSFTFVGQYGVKTDGSGTFDMRMRNYDAVIGQFNGVDPLSLGGGDTNLRRYSHNGVPNRIDPSGLVDSTTGCSRRGPTQEPTPTVEEILKKPGARQLLDQAYKEGGAELMVKFIKWIRYAEFINSATSMFTGHIDLNGDGQIETLGGTILPRAIQNIQEDLDILSGRGKCPCPCPPPAPPAPAPKEVADGTTHPRGSLDPNDIVGPEGFGAANFVSNQQVLPYHIRFENQPSATAPAQEVFVTHQLDSDLDWATFALGNFGWGSIIVTVPGNVQEYSKRVETVNLMNGNTPLLVDVTATLNRLSGVVTWVFRSVDPATGELPSGVFDGFLPPNDATHRGEGFVDYTIRPKASLATGVKIEQQASIVFDTNAPLLTNTATNTIDAVAPTGLLNVLAPVSTSLNIPLSWTGHDDVGGAGVATYDVFVSDNGGPFTLFLDDTTQTSATFTGLDLHTYRFYVLATDNVGNQQPASSAVIWTTQIARPPAAFGDVYAADAGRTLTVAATSGVLKNDKNASPARTLRAVLVDNVAKGALTLRADGSFTYVPGASFDGLDFFTYKIRDNTGKESNTAVVYLATQIVNFRSTAVTVSEGTASTLLTVDLRLAPAAEQTVEYIVTPVSATPGGVDFTLASGALTFSAGQTTRNLAVRIINDSISEGAETLQIVLSAPTNATLGDTTTHVLTIEESDRGAARGAAAASLLTDSAAFSLFDDDAHDAAFAGWQRRPGARKDYANALIL